MGLGGGVRKTAVREVGVRMRMEGGGIWSEVGVRVRLEVGMALLGGRGFGRLDGLSIEWCGALLGCSV